MDQAAAAAVAGAAPQARPAPLSKTVAYQAMLACRSAPRQRLAGARPFCSSSAVPGAVSVGPTLSPPPKKNKIQFAIEQARFYDKCQLHGAESRTACQVRALREAPFQIHVRARACTCAPPTHPPHCHSTPPHLCPFHSPTSMPPQKK